MIAQTFPLVEVAGNAYELGFQHGAQAAALVERYLLWTERLTGQTRDVLCERALAFLPYMEKLSPAFVTEVRGLAAGAGITFAEAMVCQARVEAGRVPDGGCTAFALKGAATADGALLVGQNQDLEAEYADVAILLRVKPSDGRPRADVHFCGAVGLFRHE
jgi:isopenicillin-N N-acyltransferase-like protein